jgi:micrococcal nuclease
VSLGVQGVKEKTMIKMSKYLVSAMAACALLTSCVLVGCGAGVKEGHRAGEYRVVNVLDGDTVELAGGRKVRYIGIDTPETMQRAASGWIFQPEAYGVAAKERNREMVMGREVRLEFDREKEDKYGRWLAYVYAGDTMVNLELVKEGLATVYTFPPNTMYFEEFIKAQGQAISEKRGLWGTIKSIGPEEAAKNMGRFCSVEGRVSDVKFSRGRIVLYVGGGRDNLKAIIFARNITLFSGEAVDPVSYYTGRYVRVTGKIEGKGAPEMIIDNPLQIKVLE